MMGQFPEYLKEKYRKFKADYCDNTAKKYEELAKFGQQPKTMIISCCDSRVDPESIFASGPGELFVVRNVANLVPPFETSGGIHGISAAIEFAVLNLQIESLVVMGHAGCGGIRAALDEKAAIQTEAHFISRWMSILDEAKERVCAHSHGDKQQELEMEGIKHSLKNLRTFPFVRTLEQKGSLRLFGAYFEIESGTMLALDVNEENFVAI